jgi:hypothetical protein
MRLAGALSADDVLPPLLLLSSPVSPEDEDEGDGGARRFWRRFSALASLALVASSSVLGTSLLSHSLASSDEEEDSSFRARRARWRGTSSTRTARFIGSFSMARGPLLHAE